MDNAFKRGKLFWFDLKCPQLDDMPVVRLMKKLGFDHIPLKVKKAKRVFLREDKSSYSRKLIDKCRKWGVRTYVVEEGARYSKNHLGHIPLLADYFVCLPDSYPFWESFIPKGRLLTHPVIKSPELCSKIVFLFPLYTSEDLLHPMNTNVRMMQVIERFRNDPDACFKLHPRGQELVKKFVPEEKIVTGKAEDLILKYKKIYCFKECSIRFDCELLGVVPEIL